MIITYYGVSCFKVQSGDLVFVFDPPSKKSAFKTPKFKADIVFLSHEHENHSGFDSISSKDENSEPFLVKSAGEYEIKGVGVKGIKTFHDDEQGRKFGLNTVYSVNFEDVNICHLGDFGEKKLSETARSVLRDIDVLFAPIGGDDGMTDPGVLVKIINQIEPKVIIPMHYLLKGSGEDKKKLDEFLAEMGAEKIKPLEKFSFKKKDIEAKNGEIIILKPLIN